MVALRSEHHFDVFAREALLDRCFGAERFAKASERLREGRLPAPGLSFVATDGGRLVGTLRLWQVSAGPGRPALLLGPLAIAPQSQGLGIGAALMRHAIDAAERRGHAAILLVGDAPYYGRFGFSADATRGLRLPGAYAPERFLARELAPGALARARGLVTATGRLAQPSALPPMRRETMPTGLPQAA